MDEALWEFHKSSRFELRWAVCASLLLHILLALVLSVPPATPQAAGSDGRFAISWAAPGAAAVPTPAVARKQARGEPETPVAPAQPVPARLPNATLGPKEPSEAGRIEVFLVTALRQPAPTAATPPAQKTHVLQRPTQRVASTAPRPSRQRAQAKARQEPVRIENRQPGRQARPTPQQPQTPAQLAQARARVTLQLPPAAQQEAPPEEQEDEELDATLDEDPAQTEAPEPEVAGSTASRVSGPSEAGELALSQAAALPPRRSPKPALRPASPSPPARPIPPADTSKTVAATSQPKSPGRGRENTGSKGVRVATLERPAPKKRQLPAPSPLPSRPATRLDEPLTPPSPGAAPGPVTGRATASVAGTPAARVAQEPSPKSGPRAGTGVARPEPATGAKAAPKVTATPASPASAGNPGATTSEDTDKSAAKSTAKAAASRTKPAKPAVPKTKQAAARKAQPAPSTPAALPSLHGDLKLVLMGNPDLKVTVTFRDYPRSRRNATRPGPEARQETLMTPLVVATGATTREAVLSSTQEGVYSFIVEPLHGKSARASFKLKIYESSPRERSVNLGNKTVTGPTVLLKILIPEAVLWDEEAPFTGSMEDSESETKFNADNGLFWKEFKP